MSDVPGAEPAPTLRTAVTTSAGLLTLALLGVELLAGMQSFVTATITPLAAADLDATGAYGVMRAAPEVAMFLAMPLGPALLARVSGWRLLGLGTGVLVGAATLSAAAPSIEVFVVGRLLSGLVTGVLMTVTLTLIVESLPRAWRRLLVAGYAATWILASVVGPAYAGWVSAVLDWRWAMVAYLPLLVAVRWVVIRELRRIEAAAPRSTAPVDPAPAPRRLGLGAAVVLATGIALVAAASRATPSGIALALVGAVAVVAASARLLPAGSLRAAPGEPALVAAFAVLCGVWFGGQAVLPILAHDLLGYGPARLAPLLTCGVLAWSVAGLWWGRRPPADDRALVRRTTVGGVLLVTGLAVVTGAWQVGNPVGGALLYAGWTVAGLGMGTAYLDLFNRILESRTFPAAQAAVAVALAETIATGLSATATTSVVSAAGSTVAGAATALHLALVGGGLLLVLVLRRVASPSAR